MSTLFGPMMQLGYVVRDIRAAMDWWIHTAHIGPWFFIERSPVPELVHRGTIYRDPDLSAAFANSGGMQIELIQQNCDTPSAYRDFLRAGGSGLHHWSGWPNPAEYETRYAGALARGFVVEMEGRGPRGAFAYFSKGGALAPLFELAAMVPPRVAFFDRVRDAARDWNGRDPIRDREGHPL